MYDYGLSTLEQYDRIPQFAQRARGALLCRMDDQLYILREWKGSERKLARQQEILLHLKEQGILVDEYIPNREGNLISRDKDEIPYTLQRWYEGRECDTKKREDILKSVQTLAVLHKAMRLPAQPDETQRSLKEEYVRHNAEIRKIRKFIRKKGADNLFEKKFLASVEWFLEKGEQAVEMLEDAACEELRSRAFAEGTLCHGEFNQHNILLFKNQAAVTNFSHWSFDVQMADLYCFMRKILEKYNWSPELGKAMLGAYHQCKPITGAELLDLKIRFTYPEKYWKLANYYASHKKAWISEKNVEKLQCLVEQKEQWADFAGKCLENPGI